MRTPIMAGNWKMHKTAAEAKELAQAVVAGTSTINGAEVVLCTPFTALATTAETVSDSTVKVGGPKYVLGRARSLHR